MTCQLGDWLEVKVLGSFVYVFLILAREGLHKMLPYCLRVLPMWIKFCIMDAPQKLIERICVSGQSILHCIFVHTSHIYRPIWAKFGLKELYMVVLVICGYRGNGAGKAALFLRT